MIDWMGFWWTHAPVLSVVLPSLTAVVILLLGDQGGMAAQGGSHQSGRLGWHRWVGMVSVLLGLVMAASMVWRASSGEIDLAKTPAQRALWDLAQTLVPEPGASQLEDMQAYTQGLMDLGATLCTRSRPACERCPVQALCQAHASDQVARFPIKTKTLKRRSESWWLLCHFDPSEGGWVWLEQRPQTGIWAGLYCPPVWADEAPLRERLSGVALAAIDHHPMVSHALTHRELSLHPTVVRGSRKGFKDLGEQGQWVALPELDAVGLPKPIRTWLDGLKPD